MSNSCPANLSPSLVAVHTISTQSFLRCAGLVGFHYNRFLVSDDFLPETFFLCVNLCQFVLQLESVMNTFLHLFALNSLIDWLTHYGYWVVFPLVVVEGPIITVITGSLVSFGIFNFAVAYIVIMVADLSGDSAYYAIGRYGGQKFIQKWGRFLGLKPETALNLKKHFDNKGGRTLMLGKISHGIGGIFLVAAGLAEMPFLKFIWYNFLATLVKSLALLLLGFYFGQAIIKINSIFDFIASVLICLFIAAIIVYFSFYYKNDQPNE